MAAVNGWSSGHAFLGVIISSYFILPFQTRIARSRLSNIKTWLLPLLFGVLIFVVGFFAKIALESNLPTEFGEIPLKYFLMFLWVAHAYEQLCDSWTIRNPDILIASNINDKK